MVSFFRKALKTEDEKYQENLSNKSTRALKIRRARLREKVAFAPTMAIRQRNKELLHMVEEAIREREA